MEGHSQMAQPTPTYTDLLESYRNVARMQKRAAKANREAAQVAARARDEILLFCVANGIPVEVVSDDK